MRFDNRWLESFLEAEQAQSCLVVEDPRVRESLRHYLRSGKVVCPAAGVYARTEHWECLNDRQRSLHTMRALQRLHPDWVFCRDSAAVAWGLPLSFDRMREVHVATSPENRSRSTRGVRRHVVANVACEVVDGLRVTSLPLTMFDCMRSMDFGHALSVADAALHSGVVSRRDLAKTFQERGKHRTGARKALRTLLYADGRSESAGESLARAKMIELGFALPELQVELPNPIDPVHSYRVDFLWLREDGSYAIGEFDGFVKYSDEAVRGGRSALRVLADERQRESRLSVYGMPIVRFTYGDVMDAAGFSRLLKGFGIPQSDSIAEKESKLAAGRAVSAQVFTLISLDGFRFPQRRCS